jgi:hypothetical protein
MRCEQDIQGFYVKIKEIQEIEASTRNRSSSFTRSKLETSDVLPSLTSMVSYIEAYLSKLKASQNLTPKK